MLQSSCCSINHKSRSHEGTRGRGGGCRVTALEPTQASEYLGREADHSQLVPRVKNDRGCNYTRAHAFMACKRTYLSLNFIIFSIWPALQLHLEASGMATPAREPRVSSFVHPNTTFFFSQIFKHNSFTPSHSSLYAFFNIRVFTYVG